MHTQFWFCVIASDCRPLCHNHQSTAITQRVDAVSYIQPPTK